MNDDGDSVSACRLKGSGGKRLFTPEGWEFEGSLSQTFGFQATDTAQKRYRVLRTDDGVDVYLDAATPQKVWERWAS
jgi:hypothetical protein